MRRKKRGMSRVTIQRLILLDAWLCRPERKLLQYLNGRGPNPYSYWMPEWLEPPENTDDLTLFKLAKEKEERREDLQRKARRFKKYRKAAKRQGITLDDYVGRRYKEWCLNNE